MNSALHPRLRGLLCLAAAGALMLALTGCHKRVLAATAAPPPIETGPPAPPITVPPPTHITPDAELEQPPAPPMEVPVKPTPKPPAKKPAPKPAPPVVTTPPPSSGINALGVLSTGGNVSSESRNQAQSLLRSVHQRMDAIPLDIQNNRHDQYERIRNFVKQADDAWKNGDAEGTRNLATKARVLLDEIQR